MKNKMLTFIQFFCVLLFAQVDYSTDIQSIFNDNCTGCHGNSGGLDLSSYSSLMEGGNSGAVIVAGDHTNSYLWQRVDDGSMPPGNNPDLSSEQIDLIAQWIDEGALESLSISIEEAREELGNTVTTSGIVTTPNLASSGQSDFAIQDETAAIIIYNGDFDAGLSMGDLVTVTGEILNYNGKLEIVPSTESDISVISQGNELPAFQYMTLSGLLTMPESFESELVRVFGVEIIDGDWPESGTNANLTISDDEGVTTLTLRVDRHSDVDDGPAPEGLFDLSGFVAQYDYSEPQDEGYQIIPRFQTDFEEPNEDILPILEARNTMIGETVTTAGFVSTPNYGLLSGRTDHGIQDATGGIVIFNYSSDAGLSVGDYVQVTGEIASYNGKLEIVPADISEITIVNSGNVIPASQNISISQILAAPESYESEIVTIQTANIIDGDWPDEGDNSNLTISDISDSTITMRIDKDTDVDGGLEPQGTFNLTGIVGQYDSSEPADEGYQVLPRYYSDFEVLGDVSPYISNLMHSPTNPTPDDEVTVSVQVIDDGEVEVSLNFQINDGNYISNDMYLGEANTFSGTISAQGDGVTVHYFISADDGVNETINSDTLFYIVHATQSLTSIYDVQTNPELEGQVVTIGGVVTAEFWGGSSNRNFYVQDAQETYSGIVVFNYDGWDEFGFNTPMGETVYSLAEGDSVVLTGEVVEYFDKTEITNVSEVTVYGPAVNQFEPLDVTVDQIMTDGTESEAYEGVLVRVSNVIVDEEDLGYGEWSVTDGVNSVRVDDNWDYYFWPEEDAELVSVTGVLDYTYSDFKIQPRLARDVVEAGDTRIQLVQHVLYSDLIKAGEDSESDMSYMLEDTVTISGIVTMPTGLSYAGDGVKFIFADPHGGPWSGILSYDPDSSAFPNLVEGDFIRATGYIYEYSTAGSNMTELFITQPIEILGTNVETPPEPTVLSGDLRWPTEAEQWGTVMVKVESAVITANDFPYDLFAMDDGSGSVLVDDDSDSVEVYFDEVGPPPVGTLIESARGWVYHHFGSYNDSTTYKLCPLYVSDLVYEIQEGINVNHLAGWNLVGFPFEGVDNSYEVVFPDATAGTLYEFSGTYVNASNLVPGNGYWLNFPEAGANILNGEQINNLSISLSTGWNLISGISSPVSVDQIDDINSIIVPGTVYGFDGTYQNSSTLEPGKGYWINATEAGDIAVSGGRNAKVKSIPLDYADGANVLTFDTQSIFFGVDIPDDEKIRYELPPLPPEGVQDFRYSDGSKLTMEGGDISIQQSKDQLHLSYEIKIPAEAGMNWVLVTELGDRYVLSESGEIIIERPVHSMVLKQESPVPLSFSLSQNYPNPFNPETEICFSITEENEVSLVIFDILGKEVNRIVQSKMEPGYHKVVWDGSSSSGSTVSSGIYFYRLTSGDFVNQKKMMLIR